MMDITIGPPATQNDLQDARNIIPYSSNRTASYVSNIFLGSGFNSPDRNTDNSIKLELQFCASPVENISAIGNYENCDLNLVATWLQQDIKNHIEMRLQLFLLQIMSLFQSKVKVHKFRTQAQAGDKNKVANLNTLKPTEAHAGTLPNLIGYMEEEEENTFYSDNIELKPRVFAKTTSFYNQANITHKLPSFVNDVDSDIDYRSTELENLCETFREQSVKILNKASTDSKMSPQLAFRNFMMRLYNKIQKLHPKSSSHHQWVLSYYGEVVVSYLNQNEDPNFIKRLMFDPDLDLPAIAHALRQKIQYELMLLNKIAEIQAACALILNGTQQYEEAMNCVLTLGSDDGRLALLQNNTNLSETQEGYHAIALRIPSIREAAKNIIESDPHLAWAGLPVPINFANLVKQELLTYTRKKRIKEVNVIALRILWTMAKTLQTGNKNLAVFLCFSPQTALKFMIESPALGRNVRACLKDENIKRLLVEFMLLLNLNKD